jgi:DNA-binding NtrC family response regulator/tetratricopeptide (TPR) repeat protein
VQLVADRFTAHEDGSAVDLATGAPVWLRVGTAGGVSEGLRWTVRCDGWRSLQHRAIAPLVDFGPIGETSRFEAWACGRAWSGSAVQAQAARDRAEAFLRTAGLTRGSGAVGAVHHGQRTALVVPGDETGYPSGCERPVSLPVPLESCGLRLIQRPVVRVLMELLESGYGPRPRSVVLWGPPGSGKRTVVRELARTARLHGFVPVASSLIGTRYEELLEGRTLFIIGTASDGSLASALQRSMRSPRPHVVVIVSEIEHAALDNVKLSRVSAADLRSAVFPGVDDPSQRRLVDRLAERARGLPGRFAHLLWPAHEAALDVATSTATVGSRVAEQASVYGETEIVGEPRPPSSSSRTWPAPGELAMLRRRMDAAIGLVARGRHEPGVRQLRHSVRALARRDDWHSAADGAIAMAACLLRRGQPRQALTTVEDARRFARAADRTSLVVDAAVLAGEAWIDLGRLDEAEAVLGATATTARWLKDTGRIAATSITLARCMYWRGRFMDADVALERAHEIAPSFDSARRDLLTARVSVGRGQFDRAMSLVTNVRTRANEADDLRTVAAAAYCAALIHCRIGNFDGATHELAASSAAARSAHDPLRAFRARLLQIEVDRRRGRRAVAAAQLTRLARVAAGLPVIVRARSELLAALLSDEPQTMDIISRHVKASGLGALAVYANGRAPDHSASGPSDSLAGEMIEIVRACQTADDEAVVLRDVCARVRRHIHAAAVAIVAGPGRRFAALGLDGPRMEPGIAARCIASGITIAPHRLENRIEAAVPVQYGGAPIGAICVRWILGSSEDLRRAAAVLEMAAAAAAPIVAASLARSDVMAAAGKDLLGVTRAMADLRGSVERAAGAPFPVLITGESGSGKELVARAIHRLGPRRGRGFCTLNSAALPEDLVEAELFGHARGAFTGAVGERIGVFEDAHGGTLFLDEIGELSLRAQAKVLRVIQEGEVRRVGENLSRRIDVRIIAATNRDLHADTNAGHFRTDLLYRLDVIRIHVPPLRERREDVPILAQHFWRDAAARVGSRATLGAGTLAALARYDWPGNVRELQNVVAALAVRSPKRGIVPATALPAHFMVDDRQEAWRLTDARRTFEERFVRAALARSGGHRGAAAAELGLSRQGLAKLMSRLGIAVDELPATEP